MNKKKLDFYFDFISPYAFFSWLRVRQFAADYDLELTLYPVVFGKLLDHWGQLGPAEIRPKLVSTVKYCYRYAVKNGIELVGPKFHPFNSLAASRMALRVVSGADQEKVIDAIFTSGWSQGRDIGDVAELASILDAVGVDGAGLAAKINDATVKDVLKDNTAKAIEHGVFGVPTMMIDGELFWGNDQFDHMVLYCEGNDPCNVEGAMKDFGRERGIDRKKVQGKI